ncbi:MAG: hypothetical protein H6551_13195 [Chitinophagales bacterium]|nr:hypothetical protein [Chitinophagaceae bacterium]MCB9066088.1 hypothetical protein [Chitinophagales bacterium]
MKKLILFVCTGVFIAASFSSCSKAYTCECTSIYGKIETKDVVAKSRTEAQRNCNEFGLTAHCEIK